MIAIYLSPLYILACIYMLRWLLRWMGACHGQLKRRGVQGTIIGIYSVLSLSLVVGFFLPHGAARSLAWSVGYYWMGFLVYAIFIIIVADILRLILRRIKAINQKKLRSRKSFVCGGAVCLILTAAVGFWGIFNAKLIRVTPYEISIEKDGGPLDQVNIVLVADLHLGYNIGCKQMEQMVEKINAQEPDVVVIAGDIFDNDFDALDDPKQLVKILSGIESTYGVYACYGNHDVVEPILAGFTFSAEHKKVSDLRMDAFLADAGIKLLRDEAVLIADSFYLYGRPDEERPGRGIEHRKCGAEIAQGLDMSKPVIVMDHEPKELSDLADAGIDLDLCGHTHNGQIFPGNVIMSFLWENPYGYLEKDGMDTIVTSGVGIFGPNMRVGTISEICRIEVSFSKPVPAI